VRFHHPGFNPDRFPSFPNVEQLLSEMAVNEELFHASRQYDGRFTKDKLKKLQRDVLLKVADWFHELSTAPRVDNARQEWLGRFRERVAGENAAIISFNWDLILDKLLFGEALGQTSYGFPKPPADSPVLLKPHGSLNWFEDKPGRYLTQTQRFEVHSEAGRAVYGFANLTRGPNSKRGRTYLPLIIPPIYLKRFDAAVFTRLWQNCTSALSTARKVIFLGYSMPLADLHAQFIMRCGFHNQVEGELASGGKRKPKTGAAAVTIVNPGQGSGGTHRCRRRLLVQLYVGLYARRGLDRGRHVLAWCWRTYRHNKRRARTQTASGLVAISHFLISWRRHYVAF
jgi:hypothetical protein